MVVRFNHNEFVRRDNALLFKGEAGQAAVQAREKLGAMAAQLVGSDGRVKSGYLSLHSHKDGSLSVGTRAGIFGFSDGTFQASTLVKTLVREAYGEQPHVEQALNAYMARSDVRSGTRSFVQLLRTLESGRGPEAATPGMERVGVAKLPSGTRLGQLLDRQDQSIRQWLVQTQSAVVDLLSASSRLGGADLNQRRQALLQQMPDAKALALASPALRSEAERMVAQIKALAAPPGPLATAPQARAAQVHDQIHEQVPASALPQAQDVGAEPGLAEAALDLSDTLDFPDTLDLPDEDDPVPPAPARASTQAVAVDSSPPLSATTRLDASNLQSFLFDQSIVDLAFSVELRPYIDRMLQTRGTTLESHLLGMTVKEAKQWLEDCDRHLAQGTQWARVDQARARFKATDLLSAVKLRLHNVPGDGHCAFHAMAFAEGGARRAAFQKNHLQAAVAHRQVLLNRLDKLTPKQLEFLNWNKATVETVRQTLKAGLHARSVGSEAWGSGSELALQSIETGRPLIALTAGMAHLYLPSGVKQEYRDPDPQTLADLLGKFHRAPAVLVNETDTHWMATEPLN